MKVHQVRDATTEKHKTQVLNAIKNLSTEMSIHVVGLGMKSFAAEEAIESGEERITTEVLDDCDWHKSAKRRKKVRRDERCKPGPAHRWRFRRRPYHRPLSSRMRFTRRDFPLRPTAREVASGPW